MNDIIIYLPFITIALLGLLVGSFLNVCIYRIPLKESVVFDSSHCMSCKKKLKWYELFPLFSYLCLGGKCSKCKAPISIQYPLVEFINSVLWIIVFYYYGFTIDTILGCILASTLLVLSVIDIKTFEIPPSTSLTVFILGVIRTLTNMDNLFDHIIGFFAVSSFLFLIIFLSKGKAMGGGDLKLMAGGGLFLTGGPVVLAFFIAIFLASIIHLFKVIFMKADRTLALGPYLAVGIFISFIWGNDLINWYISLL